MDEKGEISSGDAHRTFATVKVDLGDHGIVDLGIPEPEARATVNSFSSAGNPPVKKNAMTHEQGGRNET